MLAQYIISMPIVRYLADLIIAVAFGVLLGRVAAALRHDEPTTNPGRTARP